MGVPEWCVPLSRGAEAGVTVGRTRLGEGEEMGGEDLGIRDPHYPP